MRKRKAKKTKTLNINAEGRCKDLNKQKISEKILKCSKKTNKYFASIHIITIFAMK